MVFSSRFLPNLTTLVFAVSQNAVDLGTLGAFKVAKPFTKMLVN